MKKLNFLLLVAMLCACCLVNSQTRLNGPDGIKTFAVTGQEKVTVEIQKGNTVVKKELLFDVIEEKEGGSISIFYNSGTRLTTIKGHPTMGELVFVTSIKKEITTYKGKKSTIRHAVNENATMYSIVQYYKPTSWKFWDHRVIRYLIAKIPKPKGQGIKF